MCFDVLFPLFLSFNFLSPTQNHHQVLILFISLSFSLSPFSLTQGKATGKMSSDPQKESHLSTKVEQRREEENSRETKGNPNGKPLLFSKRDTNEKAARQNEYDSSKQTHQGRNGMMKSESLPHIGTAATNAEGETVISTASVGYGLSQTMKQHSSSSGVGLTRNSVGGVRVRAGMGNSGAVWESADGVGKEAEVGVVRNKGSKDGETRDSSSGSTLSSGVKNEDTKSFVRRTEDFLERRRRKERYEIKWMLTLCYASLPLSLCDAVSFSFLFFVTFS